MPSSVIKWFSYNPDTCTLRIVFVSGNVYDYKDVPAEVYHNMKNAFSKGIFFNEHIKEKYEFERVDQEQ